MAKCANEGASSAVNPLPSYLRASALDAGNASMRKACRTRWSDEDADTATEMLERLVRSLYASEADHNQPNMCFYRFQIAESLERSGKLHMNDNIAAAVDRALGC